MDFWSVLEPRLVRLLSHVAAEKGETNSLFNPLFFLHLDMLPKKNRADKKAIEQIFKKSSFLSSLHLTFKFITNQGSSKKISFIAPKTVAKGAVERNLLRRRGYTALGRYFPQLPVGILGAFIFGKKSLEVFGGKEYKEILEKEIEQILDKLK